MYSEPGTAKAAIQALKYFIDENPYTGEGRINPGDLIIVRASDGTVLLTASPAHLVTHGAKTGEYLVGELVSDGTRTATILEVTSATTMMVSITTVALQAGTLTGGTSGATSAWVSNTIADTNGFGGTLVASVLT
jgi:hypothetical protein